MIHLLRHLSVLAIVCVATSAAAADLQDAMAVADKLGIRNGDIVHEDTDRTMWVYLDATTLTGAVKDAFITLDAGSRWIATADSTVILSGDVDLSQIDAMQGVLAASERQV